MRGGYSVLRIDCLPARYPEVRSRYACVPRASVSVARLRDWVDRRGRRYITIVGT